MGTVKEDSIDIKGDAPSLCSMTAISNLVSRALWCTSFDFPGDLCLVSLIRLEHLQPNLYNKVIPEFTKKIIATVFKLKVGFGLDKSTTEGLLVNRGRVYNLVSISRTPSPVEHN
ncbi:hypothetical protein V1504DRAFT_436235 [Lipomyces starkeyi]